jgi:hypothetical protein
VPAERLLLLEGSGDNHEGTETRKRYFSFFRDFVTSWLAVALGK